MNRTLHLVVGLPGQGMHLGIDPLSVLFLCILAPQIIASAIAAEWRSGIFWICVLGQLLTVLAADAFALVLGFGLMSAAAWLLVLRSGSRNEATLVAGMALFSVTCLIPAVFLPAGNLAFALLLLGMGAQVGLAPLHAWLPRVLAAPATGVSAILSSGTVNIAFYVLIRYGFVLDGGAVAGQWGVALMVAGAASLLLGSLRAMLETDLKVVLAGSTVAHAGLVAVGLGIALQARAMDDPALAVLALQAALLCAIAHALFKPLLILGAGAVQEGTGTTSLDWLGGMLRGMPRLGALMLAGAACMAALPPGPGFAPQFLLLHAVIGAAGSGGFLALVGFTLLLGLLGVSAALALAAAVRIIGIGFLGRPRTLRAAAAEEADKRVLIGMGLLAVLCLPVALTPGWLLDAMQPVFSLLVPGGLPQPLPYAPLRLVVLLLLPAGLAFLLLRRYAAPGEREAPAWNGGFGKPPVWLPFGDPLTQSSATGFAEPIRQAMGALLLDRAGREPVERYLLQPLLRLTRIGIGAAEHIRRAGIRQRLGVVVAALAVCLLALGIGAGG